MNHILFDQICQIADDQTSKVDVASLIHAKSCSVCQKEIALQRALIVSAKKASLLFPSAEFTQNLLRVIQPSKQTHWYDRILQNMGNVIAMAAVLAFLVYIFSVAGSVGIQVDKPTDSKIVSELSKIAQNGSHQLVQLFKVKFPQTQRDQSQSHILIVAFLTLVILWAFDRIFLYFQRKARI
jgi:hypothetical protein